MLNSGSRKNKSVLQSEAFIFTFFAQADEYVQDEINLPQCRKMKHKHNYRMTWKEKWMTIFKKLTDE